MIRSYLSNRNLYLNSEAIRLTSVVPQDLILSLHFWNGFYAVVSLHIFAGLELLAFADDVILYAKTKERIITLLN